MQGVIPPTSQLMCNVKGYTLVCTTEISWDINVNCLLSTCTHTHHHHTSSLHISITITHLMHTPLSTHSNHISHHTSSPHILTTPSHNHAHPLPIHLHAQTHCTPLVDLPPDHALPARQRVHKTVTAWAGYLKTRPIKRTR